MKICRECHKQYTSENKALKREQYNAVRRIRQNTPEAKAKRALYLARPEVKYMIKEAYKINKFVKQHNKLQSMGARC
jgi:hypothetical protein